MKEGVWKKTGFSISFKKCPNSYDLS